MKTGKTTKYRNSPFRFMLIIILSIFFTEAFIMFLFSFFHPVPQISKNILDAAILIAVVSPVLYIYMYRPLSVRIAEVSLINENLNVAINARKLAEEALKKSEERYRLLFDQLPYGGEVLDQKGFIADCSTKNAELLGYERAEMIGRNITEFLSSESRPVFQEKFPLMRQGKTEQCVMLMVRKDGGLIDVERTARPLFDSGGAFSGVLALNVDITEKKRLETALSVSVERLRSIVDAIPLPVAVSRISDGTVLFANRHLRELFKMTEEDVVNSRASDYYYDPSERQILLDALSVSGAVNNFELRVKKSDGTPFWVLLSMQPLLFNNEKALIVMFYDITERRKMEEELQESEETLRGVFNGSHDGILLADAETRSFYLGNNRICRMLGYSFEELKNLRVDDIHPMEDVPEAVEVFNRMSNGNISLVPGIRVKRKDGSVFLADIGTSLVNLRQRKYVIGMFRDVTERRQLEEILKKSQIEQKAILSNIPDIAWLKDRESRFVMVNEPFGKACGVSPDELVGKTDLEIWPQNLAEQYRADDREVMESLRRKVVEEPLIDKDGKETWIETIKTPIVNNGGEVIGTTGIARDITKRKSLEEDLRRYSSKLNELVKERTAELEKKTLQADAANRVKSEFLANMSHELRTPLNAIIGFTGVINDSMAGPVTEEQKDYLGDIAESGRHLLRLIDDILALSQLETGELTLEKTEFALGPIMEGAVNTFGEKALKKKISLSLDMSKAEAPWTVEADEQKLRQTLFHLLDNALKFTPDGGAVRVSARRVKCQGSRGKEDREARSSAKGKGEEGIPLLHDPMPPDPEADSSLATCYLTLDPDGDFIEISVTDTGIGISPEDQKRLFQPFQQMESSYTKKYSGTGLGLNLCKKFVELHGGTIWVESEPGKGSRFVFVIPLRQGQGSGAKGQG